MLETSEPWSIVATVVGAAGGIIGALLLLYLRSIKACIRKADDRSEKTKSDVAGLETKMSQCKTDCERSFVDKELFLRETGFTRRTLEAVSSSLNKLDGKLTVVEKLPKICGDISREIVREMKNGNGGPS